MFPHKTQLNNYLTDHIEIQKSSPHQDTTSAIIHNTVTFEHDRPTSLEYKTCDISDWDIIAVTAYEVSQAQAYVNELLLRQRQGTISSSALIIPVAGRGAGSGGILVNTLIVIAEYLSSKAGDAYINGERIRGKRMLIIFGGQKTNQARYFRYLPVINKDTLEIGTTIDSLLSWFDTVKPRDSQAGLWICNGHNFITSIEGAPRTKFPSISGIQTLTTMVPVKFATSGHGVYKIDPVTLKIKDVLYRKSEVELRLAGCVNSDGMVPLVCGITFLDVETALKMFYLYSINPFRNSTYLGQDDDTRPVPFSFYLDIVGATAQDQLRFRSRKPISGHSNLTERDLNKLWIHFQKTEVHAVMHKNPFMFLFTLKEYVSLVIPWAQNSKLKPSMNNVQSSNQLNAPCVMNCILRGNGTVAANTMITNSVLDGSNWKVGQNTYIDGIRSCLNIELPANLYLEEVSIFDSSQDNTKIKQIRQVMVCYGIHDNVSASFLDSDATFASQTWGEFFERTGLSADDIWNHCKLENRCLMTARLFPTFSPEAAKKISKILFKSYLLWLVDPSVSPTPIQLGLWALSRENGSLISLQEISSQIVHTDEFEWRRSIMYEMDVSRVTETLLQTKDYCLRGVYARCAREKRWSILNVLDSIAASKHVNNGVAARTLAHIADVLAAFAGPQHAGPMRSGPARNKAWLAAQNLLITDRAKAVRELSKVRTQWLSGISQPGSTHYSNMLIRAARHYEGASQRLILRATATCSKFVVSSPQSIPPMNEWLRVEASVRVDIAGGWTDTPPVTYEAGGTVTNISVLLDGQRAVGAQARRIKERKLIFQLVRKKNDGVLVPMEDPVICLDLESLSDYCNPSSPAALLKTAILCSKIVSLSSHLTLAEQLDKLGSGIEIESWSALPTGTGMGTSSILAGCIVAVIGLVTGYHYNHSALVHAVLNVEQELTTGGGWQDQAGGLHGGVKISRSPAILPLKVNTEVVHISDSFLDELNQHMVLIFTGRARLARNLLQNVVRRFYARLPDIMSTVRDLKINAESAAQACSRGDLTALGKCLNLYWKHKKTMASGGAEPMVVTKMIHSLEENNMIHGASLTGAGGGGFLFAITKQSTQRGCLLQSIKKMFQGVDIDVTQMTFHVATLDTKGYVVTRPKSGQEKYSKIISSL